MLHHLIESAEAAGALKPGRSEDRALVTWASLRGVSETVKLASHAPKIFDERRLFEMSVKGLLIGWGAAAEDVENAHRIVMSEMEQEK